jgi:hypothetical protein
MVAATEPVMATSMASTLEWMEVSAVKVFSISVE